MENDHKPGESMRAYLLGLLPDERAAALEKEYFADDESFLQIESAETALIADYLAGKLRKEYRSRFEGHYLRVPELQRRVEEVRRQSIAARPAMRPVIRMRWGLAVAAALVLLGLGIRAYYYRLKQLDSATQTQTPKRDSDAPVGPVQEHSPEQARESKRPPVTPVQLPSRKSVASVRPHKSNAVPVVQPLEEHPVANAQPQNPTPPPKDMATQPSAATASSNVMNEPGLMPTKPNQQKKRIAVLDLDYGTVRSQVAAIYGSDQDVGKGIADILVENLVKEGRYTVIEHRALDKVLAEQSLSYSERANPAVVARIGKLLGVDAVIMGSVTKFGRDDKSKSFGLLPRAAFGSGGIKRSEAKAVCAISVRLVDTASGEILAAVTGEGESKRSGSSLIGGSGGGSAPAAGGFDAHASNFSQTILGEAVTQAITVTSRQLDDLAKDSTSRADEFSGLVAALNGNTLIVRTSSAAGLKVGDKMAVSRVVRTIEDPAVGKALKAVTVNVGVATVTGIEADLVVLTFEGREPAQVGDVVKRSN